MGIGEGKVMENIIKSKTRGNLVVISGPSGAGKGSIIQRVLEKNSNLWLSISMTSRSIRGQEQNGKEYYFITREEFEQKITNGELLEYTEYSGNYYGTPREKINENLVAGKDVILEIEIEGALNIKEMVPEAVFIFIMPPTMSELKSRLENRKTETKDKIMKRFKRAYQEINEVTKYNYVVVNDNLDYAVSKVEAILLAERCRVDRIEEVYLGNGEEFLHESLVDNKNIINVEREF